MKETVVAGWHRARRRCAQMCGLLLALALIRLTETCSRGPSEKRLRKHATSPAAVSRRAAEEQKIFALIERLTTVKGLEHVLTRFSDSCVRPYNGSVFEGNRSPYTLTCSMRADAYFAVRDSILDVLPRIHAAAIATWGSQDGAGHDAPYASGTVTYALNYHRCNGRYPDGTLMPAPTLKAPGLRIDWDRPHLPLRERIEEPVPCPPAGTGVYRRCSTVPDAPTSVAEARDHYGTVLTLSIGYRDSSATDYFTVPRRKGGSPSAP